MGYSLLIRGIKPEGTDIASSTRTVVRQAVRLAGAVFERENNHYCTSVRFEKSSLGVS